MIRAVRSLFSSYPRPTGARPLWSWLTEEGEAWAACLGATVLLIIMAWWGAQ